MVDRTTLQMFRAGALVVAHLDDVWGAPHEKLGIKSEDWTVLRSETAWNAEQATQAFAALPRLLDGSLRAAGLPSMPLCAEYIGAVLCQVVRPVNWLAAATQFRGLDGKRLIAPGGDDRGSRENISPERLFSLMLAHYHDVPASIPVDPADKAVLEGVQQDGGTG